MSIILKQNNMINDLKISIHQMNTVTGDLNGNTAKILKCIDSDVKNNVNISVFPETAITGYCCGALYNRSEFISDQLDKLQEIIKHNSNNLNRPIIILGYVSFHGINRSGFPILKNTVAVIDNNGLRTYDKQLLADTDHHEDAKYFIPGNETKIFEVYVPSKGNIKIGVPICEDSWFVNHERNIPQEMVSLGAELLIIPNQSYFYYGKQKIRKELFSKIAKDNMVPVVTMNSCGLGDIVKNIIIYDGGSMVYNKVGRLVKELPRFEEVSESFRLNECEPIVDKVDSKYKEISDAIIFEQKEFFKLCGIEKAQVHVSGGLDSSIVASLVYKAMGKDNTIFISNPSSLNGKSKDYVNQMDEKLGTFTYWQPIQSIVNEILASDKLHMTSEPNNAPEIPKTGESSIHAVLRTVLGLYDTHRFKSGIVCTGNHTEQVLGWFSLGDVGSIGVHSLIGDLTKVELYELSDYINKEIYKEEIIPYDLYNGVFKPAAELPDANEDPIDYWVQSGICASLIRDRKSKSDLIYEYNNETLNSDYFPRMEEVYKYNEIQWSAQLDFAITKMKNSVYKCAQSAPIVIISPRSRGFSNRETLINKYTF